MRNNYTPKHHTMSEIVMAAHIHWYDIESSIAIVIGCSEFIIHNS
jgi:hypothetical protein